MLIAATEELVLLFLVFVTGLESKLYEYGLDNHDLCKGRSIVLQKIEDNDLIVMKGKTDRDNPPFRECTIKFSPSSTARKRTTMIIFESFHIYDCGIYLTLEKSPGEFFDDDVSTVFNFSCSSKPGKTPFYTNPDNFILITLRKLDHKLLAYNFIFNITLTDVPPEAHFSTRILIGIGILIAIAVPGIACVIFKYLKVRRWSKRQEEREEELTSQSLQPLSRFPINNSSESTNRYSSMPLGESTSAPTHTHTCIIDSIGPDGRCTVCNRMHENYAHVVSMTPDNQVARSTNPNNTCHLCNRSHEDFAHFVEINGTTRVINDPVDSSCHSHRHRPSGEHLHHQHHHHSQNHENRHRDNNNLLSVLGDEGQSASEDDDIDLSGNDLIPPSYDLSPPSYDEAIHMPKPSLNAGGCDEETDPLYQNIDHSQVISS